MKKLLLTLLALVMCVSMCACGTSNSSSSASQATNNNYYNNSKTEESKNVISKEDASIEEIPEQLPTAVTKKQKISTDNAEFNVDYADITKDVTPPQPASFYTHYEAENGKVYVDLCIAYKNTSTGNIRADKTISATLLYDEKYEYSGFSIIEKNNRSSFTYTNITNIAPLSTEYVHYLFSVPEEVETSGDSVVITFTIDENKYTYKVK